MKYFYVRRKKDGKVMDVPENDLRDTLKRGFELIEEIKLTNPAPAPVVKAPEQLDCPICGFTAKSALGLGSHKRSHA